MIAVIKDRDIAIGLGTREQRASELFVSDVMSKPLYTCTTDDDLHTALKTLRAEGIRRLPVIDHDGALAEFFLSTMSWSRPEHILSRRIFLMRT